MNADSCQQFCFQLSAVLLSAVSSSALSCQQFCSQLSADQLSAVSTVVCFFYDESALCPPGKNTQYGCSQTAKKKIIGGISAPYLYKCLSLFNRSNQEDVYTLK